MFEEPGWDEGIAATFGEDTLDGSVIGLGRGGAEGQRYGPKPKLEPFLPVIHQILEDDKKAPKKQRHTAHRIFERLRDEYGYQGGLSIVKAAVASWRLRSAEVFRIEWIAGDDRNLKARIGVLALRAFPTMSSYEAH